MNCFMFPGQPLSPCTTLPYDADFRELSALVRDLAGLDLQGASWPEGEGNRHVKLQLLGVALSLHRLRSLKREGSEPELVTEHSMGIYPALVACGSLSEREAIELTWRIGAVLARTGPSRKFALGCVVGLTVDTLLPVARRHGVHLANHNTTRHILLSGRRENMVAAMEAAMEADAFSAKVIDYDAPLHSPLMAPFSDSIGEIVAGYRYAEPLCPLVNHLDQRRLTAPEIPRFLVEQLSRPVWWDRTYRELRALGVSRFVEVGTGDALKKYNRWIDGEPGS